MNIPIYKPSIDEKESRYVNEALNSSWISSKGKFINQFEKKFSEYTGISNSLSVTNGTVALHLALLALGIGKGDEVIVPSLTYIASVNCIKYVEAKPIFVDSDLNWQASISDIKQKINRKTKAIIVVHLYGFAAPIEEIRKIAINNKIFLIEDCAEAIGTTVKKKHVGNFSDISTFSFYGNKTITTGEGGMVCTNNELLAKKIYQFKTQGLAKDKEYWHEIIGYNYRMTNICAALGLAQIQKLDKFLKKKKHIFEYYKTKLSSLNITFQNNVCSQNMSSYWMICFLLDKDSQRDELRDYLKDKGIETRPIFYPIHLMPMYKGSKGDFPIAENIAFKGINLPSYPELTQNELDYICSNIISFFDGQK